MVKHKHKDPQGGLNDHLPHPPQPLQDNQQRSMN